MSGDYPTEDELRRVREWDGHDPRSWFAYIKSVGHYWPEESFGWSEEDTTDDLDCPVHRYRISTGGWSGNEDIIEAMGENEHFMWQLVWASSRRGGHYVFEVPADML